MSAFYNSESFQEDHVFRNTSDGIRISRADRAPCPVCGHPTGDCVGDSGPPTAIFGYDTHSTLDDKTTFLITEDIFDEVQIAPGIKTRLLIHRKGKTIPFEKAVELGLVD